jgi:hypothetical protein
MADEPVRVAVEVLGSGAPNVRRQIADRLDDSFTVADPGTLHARLAKKDALAAVFEPQTHARALERLRKAALDSGLRGAIVARVELEVSRSGVDASRRAHVIVIDSAGPTTERDLVLGAPEKSEAELLAAVSPAIETWVPATAYSLTAGTRPRNVAAPSPSPAPLRPALDASPLRMDGRADADVPASPASAPGEEMTRGLFVGSGALGVGARHFSFRDGLSPNLRQYNLGSTPIVSLAAELYPLARQGGVLADLGLVGDYQQALFVSSRGAEGSVDTSWRTFDAGARARFRVLGAALGASVTYGQTSFDVGPASPSVAYGYVRGGLDGRFEIAQFALMIGAGYEAVLSQGPLGDLFQRASTGGIDARVGAGYRLARGLEVRATAMYARFFSNMGSEPGDANVAGGALDQLMTATIGATFAR